MSERAALHGSQNMLESMEAWTCWDPWKPERAGVHGSRDVLESMEARTCCTPWKSGGKQKGNAAERRRAILLDGDLLTKTHNTAFLV